MSEQTEQPEKEPTAGAFQRIGSANYWRSNGNGIAQANGSGTSHQTEIAPDCGRCKDSLWVLASGDGSGSNLVVVPCSCQATADHTRSQLQTYSQLEHLERMTFDTLIPEGRYGRADEALFRAATQAATEFASQPTGWLVFEGSTGSGKTHLAAAIVNAIIGRGSPAKYISALNIPDMLRNERFQDDDAESGTFEALLEAPILVIDDLGAQQATNWIDSKIDQLLTHRFNGRIPTVVVVARSASDMPERIALKLDDPGFSKMVRLTASQVSGGHYRVNIDNSMLERMTFDTFEPNGSPLANETERDTLHEAFVFARDFAEKPKKWLYLHGPAGVGKTHIAVAIANVQLTKGASVTLWSMSDLLDELRQTYSNPNETDFYTFLDSVRSSELFILDDFSPEQMTDWALEKLYQIIRHRHDRLMPTVIISQDNFWSRTENRNWDRVRGKHQWESIRSRICDTSVVTARTMGAPDYRNRGGGHDPDN